jgi:hypothetical protein
MVRYSSKRIASSPGRGFWIVEQTFFALLREPPPALCLILLAQPQSALEFLLLPIGLLRLLLLRAAPWASRRFPVVVALADPSSGHAIAHLLASAPCIGQTLVVREQARELARTHADVGADVTTAVVYVLEFGEGLDDVDVVAEVLCDFGRAAV